MQNFGRENAHALMGKMETRLSASHQVYCKTALSSADAPARYLNKNSNNRKIGSPRGTMGRGKRREPLFSLSPSHPAPRALYFFLPSLPTTQSGLCGGCGGERQTVKLEAVCFVALFPYKV